ncbi:S8 family peptidase [Roseivirga thermotolerans]|uniref:S8 family peptidase n=1 Tax=Roseivirga thermotolerans TaxID=1758176 RepID=UPI0016737EAE|nr:S8 family peptidase [Roseivirga thermotolerans]
MKTVANRLLCALIAVFFWGNSELVLAQVNTAYSFFERETVLKEVKARPDDFYAIQTNSHASLHGLKILRPLANGWFIIDGLAAKAIDPSTVQSVWKVGNSWKLSANVALENTMGTYVVKGLRTEVLRERLDAEEIDYRLTNHSAFIVRLTSEQLQHILQWPEVHYVGNEQLFPIWESKVLDLNLVPNRVRQLFHHYPNLKGQNELVSIKENGFDPNDLDLWGRSVTTPRTAEDTDNHATEMATIIAGTGNTSVLGLGVASKASLTSSFPQDLFPDDPEYFNDWGIQIQNHSYGTRIENFYGALASAYDEHAWQTPPVLHVFSSGNLGLETSSEGPYAGLTGYANLSGNFKMAKNTLLVGAVDTLDRPVLFSSNGPTYDGRVKPDLVAYSMFGSSNSAALTSGVAVLLQQKYKQINNEPAPAALLRALLINGADDVFTPGPDFKTGFGSLNAFTTMRALEEERYISGVLSNGVVNNHTVQIPPNISEFKATLVWTDPAAVVNSDKAIVHDLDFKVLDVQSNVWQPFVLNPNPSNLSDEAVTGRDSLNTVEQIRILNPSPGFYTLRVEAFNHLGEDQPYVIAYDWKAANQFNWVYPTGSDHVPYNGETTGYLRWNSTLAAHSGELWLTLNEGDTWQQIASGIDLRAGLFRWRAPDTTATAQLKMVVEGNEYLSDEFVVHRTTVPRIGYFCGDSTRIAWKQLPAAMSYEVLNWNNGSMETVLSTTDTAAVFQSGGLNSRFLSIRAVLKNGKKTLASLSVNYEFGTGCYLNSFFITEQQEGGGVELELALGTVAGIEQIRFLHREGVEPMKEIGVVAAGNFGTTITFVHDSPADGYNGYRVELHFENGEQIRSEELSTYWLNKVSAAVFPNPVEAGGDLNVYLRDNPVTHRAFFTLYNSSGHVLLTEPIVARGYSFRIPSLSRGMYFYTVTNGLNSQRGRLVVK